MSSSARLRETIAECVADLQSAESSSDHHRQRALQSLYNITKTSPQHRNLVAQTNLVPNILVSLITKSASTMEMTLALSILFNLSLNPNLKQSLAEMENIVHLNSSLIFSLSLSLSSPSSSSAEVTKLIASLLCSLAMLDKNKARFGVAGTIQILISAISEAGSSRTPAFHHHLLSTLAEVVQFQGNCTLAVRSGAVPLLIKMGSGAAAAAADHGEDIAGTALGMLCSLARFEEGLSEIKRTDGIVGLMLEVLKGRCMMSKESAAEILLRLFDESERCLVDSLRFPDSLSVVADLSVRGSTKAREKAAALMKKMIQQEEETSIAMAMANSNLIEFVSGEEIGKK